MVTHKTITKARLKEMYESMSNKDICEALEITEPTLLSYIKKAGIEFKGKGNRKSKKITIEG